MILYVSVWIVSQLASCSSASLSFRHVGETQIRCDYAAVCPSHTEREQVIGKIDSRFDINALLSKAFLVRAIIREYMNDMRGARTDFFTAIALDPHQSQAYFYRGWYYYTAIGEYQLALLDVSKSIQIDPSVAFYYYARGELRFRLSMKHLAEQDFDEAIRLNSDFVFALNGRAKCLLAFGQYEQAKKVMDKAILLDSKSSESYYNRSKARRNMSQLTEALADIDISIQLNSGNWYLYNERGIIWSILGRHSKALKDFSLAIDLNPKSAVAYYNRGVEYGRLNECTKALSDLNASLRLDRQCAASYLLRGKLLANLRKWDESIRDFGQAIDLDKDGADAYWARGTAFFLSGRYAKAIDDFDIVIKHRPRDGEVLYSKARCNACLSQSAAAIDALTKALEFGCKETPRAMMQDPALRSLHDDPRFIMLLKKYTGD